MFLIILTYTAPLHLIDERLDEHTKFLERGYADGTLIVSGRQVPRTGGVIISRAPSRDDVDAFIKEDPFHIHELADYWIIEMEPSLHDPGFARFIE